MFDHYNFLSVVVVQALLWLKQWDTCVFGSHIRTTSDDVLSDLRRHSILAHQDRQNKIFKTFNNNNRNSFSSRESNNLNIPEKNSSLQETLDSWSKNCMLSLSSLPEQKVTINTFFFANGNFFILILFWRL